VINGRERVHPSTRKLVEDALHSIGLISASLPPAKATAPQKIEVVVSEGSNPFFAPLWAALEEAAARLHPTMTIPFHGFDPYRPETLVARLSAIDPDTDCVVTVGVDECNVARAIDSLVARGVQVITIVSDVSASQRHQFVGQDNFAAGRTAGRLMLNMVHHTPGRLAVLIGHLQFRHLVDRKGGFEQFIGLNSQIHEVVTTPGFGLDAHRATQIVQQLDRDDTPLVGVYLCGGGVPSIYDAVTALRSAPSFVAHELNATTRELLIDDELDAVIAYDMRDLAEKAFAAAAGDRIDRSGIQIFVKESL